MERSNTLENQGFSWKSKISLTANQTFTEMFDKKVKEGYVYIYYNGRKSEMFDYIKDFQDELLAQTPPITSQVILHLPTNYTFHNDQGLVNFFSTDAHLNTWTDLFIGSQGKCIYLKDDNYTVKELLVMMGYEELSNEHVHIETFHSQQKEYIV